MKMNTHSDIDSQESIILADIYQFLAFTMGYPEPELIDNPFLDAMEKMLENYEMHSEQQEIDAWRQSEKDANLSDTLQIEYTRLFINAAPKIIAPPYASFYIDGDQNLQGKTTQKTRDYYRQYGCDITNPHEPADHIRLELEFLASLCRDYELDAEEIFLNTLFRPWFNQFYHRIIEDQGHPFYRVSVQLIDYITKEEQ